ncbi:uncharacterized protein LOC108864287 [Galendromus occidentalis]|uniref:Uncharacterized protein LOC108864287 n=1 Tax=Galendromus occidentalis TaxID=34638 RepID=A0AAJ7L660_9ACAR|nr:uncharacterized protein LOC108864287 [Galendromus occidentalis]
MELSLFVRVLTLVSIVNFSGAAQTIEPKMWDSVNTFGFRLLTNASTGSDENVLVSPLAAYTALIVAASGTSGATRSNILKILQVQDISRNDIEGLFSTFTDGKPSDVGSEPVPNPQRAPAALQKTSESPHGVFGTPQKSFGSTFQRLPGDHRNAEINGRMSSLGTNRNPTAPRNEAPGMNSLNNMANHGIGFEALYGSDGSFYELPKAYDYEEQRIDVPGARGASFARPEMARSRTFHQHIGMNTRDSSATFKNAPRSAPSRASSSESMEYPEEYAVYRELDAEPSELSFSRVAMPRDYRSDGRSSSRGMNWMDPAQGQPLIASKAKLINQFYVNESVPLRTPYVQELRRLYRTPVLRSNFQQSELTRQLINSVMSLETEGSVAELLEKPLSTTVVSMMVNSLHFKGIWSDPVSEVNQDRPFNSFCVSDKRTNSRWIRINGVYPYTNLADFGARVFRIPLKSDDVIFSLVLVLPHRKFSCDLVSWLNRVNQWAGIAKSLSRMEDTNVDLILPKFDFDQSIELTEVVEGMAEGEIFTSANSSIMTTSRGMKLDKIIHKTRLSFNEHGTNTDAPAKGETSGVPNPSKRLDAKNVTIAADRPFLLSILAADPRSKTEVLLFSGIVNHL